MLRLPPADRIAPQWQTWDIAPGVTLELLLDPPTFADQLSTVDALQSRIKDWRGVEDDQGEPVGYSFEALDRVISLHPDSTSSLLKLMRSDSPDIQENPDINSVPTNSTQERPATTVNISEPPNDIAQQSDIIVSGRIESAGPPLNAESDVLPEENRPNAVFEPATPEAMDELPRNPRLVDDSAEAVLEQPQPMTVMDASRDMLPGIKQPPETESSAATATNLTRPNAKEPTPEDHARELARQLQQATLETSQMRNQQQQMQQSLEEAWRVLHRLSGRGANATQRAQLSGGGR